MYIHTPTLDYLRAYERFCVLLLNYPDLDSLYLVPSYVLSREGVKRPAPLLKFSRLDS
jgi:hypothetical protein